MTVDKYVKPWKERNSLVVKAAMLTLFFLLNSAVCLLADDPGETAFNAARELFTQGRYADALTAFNSVRANYPTVAAKSQRMIGCCYQWQSDFDRAIIEYQRLLTDYPDTDPAKEAHFWLGTCYESKSQYPEAIAEFFSQAQANPTFRTAETLHKLATRYREANDAPKTTLYFNRLRDLTASTDREKAKRANLLIGSFLRESGKWAEAASHYQAIKPLYPEEAEDIQFLLAESQFASGQYGVSAISYQEFLQRFPNNAKADYSRLRIEEAMRDLGNTDEALGYLRQLAALGGSIEPDALLRQAEILGYYKRDADSALDLCDQLETRFPQNRRLLGQVEFTRGMIYLNTFRQRLAREHFQRMLDNYPDRNLSVEAACHLATTYFAEKDYTKAREMFLKAARDYECPVDGWKAYIKYMAASCLYHNHHYSQAVIEWQAVIRDHPTSDWAREAQRMIRLINEGGER